jgi:endonuclease/exonuclease/phosphatase family metal-dependent hydrolase
VTTDRTRAARPVLLGGAAIGLLLVEALRAWMPSVLFVVGGATSVRAILVVLLCLATAPLAGSLTGRTTPRALWVLGTLALVLGHLALLVADGGAPRLVASSAAVVGAGITIAALAAGSVDGRLARVGLLAGAAAAQALHAALGTLGLGSRSGAVATLAAIGLVLAAGWAAARASRELSERGSDGAWPWLALGPSLTLLTVLVGPAGRVATATGWESGAVTATAVGLQALVALAAMLAPPGRAVGTAAAALTMIGTAGSLAADAPAAVAAQALLAVGVGLAVGSTRVIGRTAGPAARGVAAGSALPILGGLLLAYYAAYERLLPGSNRATLLVAALLVGGAAVVASRPVAPSTADPTRRLLLRAAALTALAAVALGALGLGDPARPPVARTADATTISVLAANVHLGFDDEGRFTAPRVGALVRELDVDVVVLNAVDRGWVVSGSHDVAAIVARASGMTLVFAPAADEVWGNAVLSRLPVVEVIVERLPRGLDPMQRSVVAVVVEQPDGGQVAVIGTHLSDRADRAETRLLQAQAVAALAARMRERGLATIVAGDLNAGPEDEAFVAFAPLLRGALPPWAVTFPADRPRDQFDHVLVSADLGVVRARVLDERLSDHRFLHVVLERLAAADAAAGAEPAGD